MFVVVFVLHLTFSLVLCFFFFFNDTATTEIYTLSLHDALPILHANLVWEFVFACIAVLPLAAWIGVATEQLAHRMGPTYGALFNATFGNFAEMVIAIFAIRAGLPDVVRASFAGSVLGNLLFVAGLSMIAGGIRSEEHTS